MTAHVQRWRIGDATLTAVVEMEGPVPPEFFFAEPKAEDIQKHGWLVPHFATEDGRVILRIQALVVEAAGRCIVVDPCVGNGKQRAMVPFWSNLQTPFLARLAAAGVDRECVDTVVHTHLHADHIGWDTMLVDGVWVPTFPAARHLYTQREIDYWRSPEQRTVEDSYADSIEPIFAAGLADVVAEDHEVGPGLRLESTRGHTPGHVSLRLHSAGVEAVITGDLMHHPVQCSEPQWREHGDWDADIARDTRRRFLEESARSRVLVIGTHFPNLPAGHIVAHGSTWRFEPIPAETIRVA